MFLQNFRLHCLVESEFTLIKLKVISEFNFYESINVTTEHQRPLDVFWTSYVRSMYVMCPGV